MAALVCTSLQKHQVAGLRKTYVQGTGPSGLSIMSDAQTGDLESPHCLHHVSLSGTALKGDCCIHAAPLRRRIIMMSVTQSFVIVQEPELESSMTGGKKVFSGPVFEPFQR